MISRQTTEQKRAKSAWDNVNALSSKTDKIQKEYGSLARGLPTMIQINGLGQTLAFLRAKGANKQGETGEKAHKLLYRHLEGWVLDQLTRHLAGQQNKPTDLLVWIINNDTPVYRRATSEALAYALWLRRFAEAQGWGDDGGGE